MLIDGNWGKGRNNWGVIVTGNINIDIHSMVNAGDMAITLGCPMEGERFEKFRELAAAAKADGSLIVAQVNHPGRQVQSRMNKIAVSASNVRLRKLN